MELTLSIGQATRDPTTVVDAQTRHERDRDESIDQGRARRMPDHSPGAHTSPARSAALTKDPVAPGGSNSTMDDSSA
jgi:hypothetical protein